MSLENIGLGVDFSFDTHPAIEALDRAHGAFLRLSKESDNLKSKVMMLTMPNFDKVGAGISKIGGSLQSAAMAAAPLGIALGFGAKKAIDFEKQMGAVNAATGATPEEMAQLTAAAKKFGVTTVFSATEAGQAMENLAKAGFDTKQTLQALPGVMAAAAAETIPLEQATDIVAQVLRGMNLEVSESTDVANKLAMAAAKTNTSIPDLGESFKYGGSQARALGYDLKQTAAAFGILADAGLRGSIGGTALGSMLTHLIKPSRKGKEAIDQLGIVTATADGKMKPMAELVEELTSKLGNVRQQTERARLATIIFGVEGARAYNAFEARGSKALGTLTSQLDHASDGIGFAQEQATKRLDNFAGAFKLFGANMEQAAIEIFGPLLKPFTESLKGLTQGIQHVIFAVQTISGAGDDAKARFTAVSTSMEKFGVTATNMALGILDAIETIKSGWASLMKIVDDTAKSFGASLGGDVRELTKFALVFTFVAAAAIPVIGAIGAIIFLLDSVLIPMVVGVGMVLSAALLPAIFWLGLLAAAWETLSAIIPPFWAGIKAAAGPVMDGLMESFMLLWEAVKFAFTSIGQAIFGTTMAADHDWKEFGINVISVLAAIVQTAVQIATAIVLAFTVAVRMLIAVGQVIWYALSWPFVALGELIGRVVGAFSDMFSGNVLQGLAKLGLAIVDFVLTPLRAMVKMIIALAESIPGVEVPAGVKTFANDGLTGFAFPTPVEPKPAAGLATDATNAKAREKQKAGQAPTVNATVKVEDQRKLEINNKLSIDGSDIAVAMGKHKQEINERAGFKATPWQRRMALENGSAPMKGGGQ